jgi:regulator of sigma E protease
MSYVVVAIVIGLLIAIHEFGHLLAAKLCGIPVRRFSIGFGPRLFGFTRGDTSYWFSLIPIGGYVWPALEEEEFGQLPASRRIAFALGGPVANIAAAFVGLFVLGLSQFSTGAAHRLIAASAFAAASRTIGSELDASFDTAGAAGAAILPSSGSRINMR